jgi:methyltransferase (TIGR00027 family)
VIIVARSDDDAWGITEGVGATAMGMAMARAAESACEESLFTDPYAQAFIDAAVSRGWTPPFTEETLAQLAAADPQAAHFIRAMTDYGLCRTRHLDDFFRGVADDGITQIVILASGLDTRGWRLPWHPDTVVYEIDQPQVLEFKADVLTAVGARSSARTVLVPIDLRDDWPAALTAAGLDESTRTAWSVEGLLPYLPPDAQTLLFERIADLSAPGSRLVVDAYTAEFYGSAGSAHMEDATSRIRSTFTELDGQPGPASLLDRDQLLYNTERDDCGDWLARRGWDVTRVSALDTMRRFGRAPGPDVDPSAVSADFITATRT